MAPGARPETLLDCLLSGYARDPSRNVYTLLGDGDTETETCNHAELTQRSMNVASLLSERNLNGHTALLLIRHPLRFIESFLGCLWAGVVPVPAAIPRQSQPNRVLSAIAENAGTTAVISDLDESAALSALLSPAIPADHWLDVRQLAAASAPAHEPKVSSGEIAFLQYTSGSTGQPKGIMVSHANLIANQRALQSALNQNRDSVFVSWLPLYHDMGLMGHALPPVFLGARCILMPPTCFLQRPVRWLRAISKYRGEQSGGPNFAYDLCVQKITPEMRAGLDLSSWEAAYNGGEPIRADTIDRFYTSFAGSGFRRNAVYPCYGLAESTLVVTGNALHEEPRILSASKAALAMGSAKQAAAKDVADSVRLVCSGFPAGNANVIIVDPHTLTRVSDGRVGEIWTSSDSVCRGYFRLEQQSQEQFAARLSDGSGDTYLRTGDLGFMDGGQLFVTGRLKDVIIIRGHNHYPHDLEATASRCHPMLAPGLAAAVMLDADEDEDGRGGLYMICEMTRQGWLNGDSAGIRADVREAIANEHGLTVSEVVLIKPGSLPRTTSGKVRRSACRDMTIAGTLETLEELA